MDWTEKDAIEFVYEELSGGDGLPSRLRRGEGMDQDAFDRLTSAIRFLIERFRSRTEVPKKLALAFVDIQAAMEWGRDQYSDEEQDRIEDAGVEIVSLASELLDTGADDE